MSADLPPHEFLARFPRLAALAQSDVRPLLECLERREVPAGELLIRHRSRSQQLLFIWSGRLRVWLEGRREQLALGEVGAGRWVGEATLLDHGGATASVSAAEPSVLFALSHASFEALRAAHPALAARLIQALSRDLADRLRQTQLELITPHNEREEARLAGERLIGAEVR